jgi:hypothetical protein
MYSCVSCEVPLHMHAAYMQGLINSLGEILTRIEICVKKNNTINVMPAVNIVPKVFRFSCFSVF